MALITLKPSPTLQIMFSAGMGVLSKYTSAVFEHLIPIFFSGGPLVTPPKSLSTIKAAILSLVVPSSCTTGTLQNTKKCVIDSHF